MFGYLVFFRMFDFYLGIPGHTNMIQMLLTLKVGCITIYHLSYFADNPSIGRFPVLPSRRQPPGNACRHATSRRRTTSGM